MELVPDFVVLLQGLAATWPWPVDIGELPVVDGVAGGVEQRLGQPGPCGSRNGHSKKSRFVV